MAEARVDEVNAAVAAMAGKRELPNALRGGTDSMRSADEKYLPREPGETVAAYQARRDKSFLFGAYNDTIVHLGGKPFVRGVVLEEGSPAFMQEWVDNVDLTGTSLTQFAKTVFTEAIDDGVTYALVDFPATGGKLSLAEEKTRGVRPNFVHVPVASIIGWRTRFVDGIATLEQLRVKEDTTEPVGAFGETLVERIRVFDRVFPKEARTATGRKARGAASEGGVFFTIWKKDPSTGKWSVEKATTAVSISEIPFRAFYTNRTGFLTGEPPLSDLAWKNLEHWQSSSDQRHILHVARVPLLFGSGIKRQVTQARGRAKKTASNTEGNPSLAPDVGETFEIGVSRLLLASDPDAKLMYVEHKGEAIGAGNTDIRGIEDQMGMLGLRPMVERTGSRATATERSIEDAEATSDLTSWVRDEEKFIEELFDLGADWVNQEGGASVDIHSDFGVGGDAAEIDKLIAMRDKGELTRETFYRELVRRGFLAETFDGQAEAVALAALAPSKPNGAGESGTKDGDGDGVIGEGTGDEGPVA